MHADKFQMLYACMGLVFLTGNSCQLHRAILPFKLDSNCQNAVVGELHTHQMQPTLESPLQLSSARPLLKGLVCVGRNTGLIEVGTSSVMSMWPARTVEAALGMSPSLTAYMLLPSGW